MIECIAVSCLHSHEYSLKNNVLFKHREVFVLFYQEDSTTKYDEEYEILRTVFLVVLPFVIFVCLLLCFGIIYRKCYSKKKQEMKDSVHNALYITEEGNRENSVQSNEDTTGDPLYGTCEDPCYSTLTLRVNYGPVHASYEDGSLEDFNPYDFMYEGEGNMARVQETHDSNFYLNNESVQMHINSTQRLYEDPWTSNNFSNSLLRHSTQRRFDLMPVDECCSALQGKEYGPYELASNN